MAKQLADQASKRLTISTRDRRQAGTLLERAVGEPEVTGTLRPSSISDCSQNGQSFEFCLLFFFLLQEQRVASPHPLEHAPFTPAAGDLDVVGNAWRCLLRPSPGFPFKP